MATAAASQWAFNYVLSKITPYLVTGLPNGKLFFLFGAINVSSDSLLMLAGSMDGWNQPYLCCYLHLFFFFF